MSDVKNVIVGVVDREFKLEAPIVTKQTASKH